MEKFVEPSAERFAAKKRVVGVKRLVPKKAGKDVVYRRVEKFSPGRLKVLGGETTLNTGLEGSI